MQPKTHMLLVDDIPVCITKKKQKHAYLRILPPDGQVCVSAPIGYSDRAIESFVRAKLPLIRKAQARIERQQLAQASKPQLTDTQKRQKLQAALEHIIPVCEAQSGLRAEEYRIRKMKTRWGSCNQRAKRIWLSLQLADMREELIAYVVYHELTHLVELRHNQNFYTQLARYCPDWKQLRKELNGQ